MITRKIGRDLAHTRQAGLILGRARSERRYIRGPVLGEGAAMRVRLEGWRSTACLRTGRERWIWVGWRRKDKSAVESRSFMAGQIEMPLKTRLEELDVHVFGDAERLAASGSC